MQTSGIFQRVCCLVLLTSLWSCTFQPSGPTGAHSPPSSSSSPDLVSPSPASQTSEIESPGITRPGDDSRPTHYPDILAVGLEISTARRIFSARGQQEQLTAIAYNSAGERLSADVLQLSWSSSRPEDIAISPTGLVSILTDAGFSQIVLEEAHSGLRADILLSVAGSSSSSGGGSSGGSGSSGQPAPASLHPTFTFEGLEEDPA